MISQGRPWFFPALALLMSFTILLTGLGCAKRELSKESELERAYRLIDLKRGAEAILVLDPYYSTNPKDREVLLALASAHASIAQLEIYNYHSLYQEYLKIRDRKIESPSGSPESINGKLTEVSNVLYRIADLLVLFRNLPQITTTQLPHLNEAIRLVSGIQPQDPSSSLFLALLRTVELKTFLYDKILTTSTKASISCQLNMELVPTRIRDLVRRFGQIVLNLTVAFKKSAETLNETKAVISSAEMNLEKLRQAGQAIDLLSKSFTQILFSEEILRITNSSRKNLCQ